MKKSGTTFGQCVSITSPVKNHFGTPNGCSHTYFLNITENRLYLGFYSRQFRYYLWLAVFSMYKMLTASFDFSPSREIFDVFRRCGLVQSLCWMILFEWLRLTLLSLWSCGFLSCRPTTFPVPTIKQWLRNRYTFVPPSERWTLETHVGLELYSWWFLHICLSDVI